MTAMSEFLKISRGWLFSLNAEQKNSAWGSPDKLLHDLSNGKREGGWLLNELQSHGKVYDRDCRLLPGDGLAFYHRKRACFGPDDRFGRRQRISTFALIDDVQQAGLDVSLLRTRTPIDLFEAMEEDEPIVWTPERDSLFESCGLKSGVVRTFYPVSSAVWAELIAATVPIVEEYTGETV